MTKPLRIDTSHLQMVEVTSELARANLDDVAALARLLDASIASTWPPEHWEPAAIQWLINHTMNNPEDRGWGAWYVLLRVGAERILIGTCGCKGPPDASGMIEVGYGIVSEYQRRGFASEATAGLIDWALRDPRVNMITAETIPNLVPSLGVMRRLGMTYLGEGSELGTVRYGVTREAWTNRSGGSPFRVH